MAKLKNNPYPPQPFSGLRHPIVIVIDMINGFVNEGALADRKIRSCIEPIERILKQSGDSLFITDCHDSNSMEFRSFPSHCLKDSEESKIVPELAPYAEKVLPKNCISAYAADGFSDWLQSLPAEADLILTGCCTDLCVLQLALPLQSWIHQNQKEGLRLIVPADCVETYDIPGIHDAEAWNEMALKNMAASGIQVVSGITEN